MINDLTNHENSLITTHHAPLTDFLKIHNYLFKNCPVNLFLLSFLILVMMQMPPEEEELLRWTVRRFASDVGKKQLISQNIKKSQ